MVEPAEKRARTETRVGTMPPDLKGKIENALAAIGEVEYHKRSHKKGSGPVQPKVLPEEDLVHDKAETIRKGGAGRVHYKCSNAKCEQLIRADKWETHAIAARSDRHLQEPAEDVLERSMNFAPEAEWDTKASRMARVVQFMEQRHYLALARQRGEADLAKKITDTNRFYVRLTNMATRLKTKHNFRLIIWGALKQIFSIPR